MSRTVFPFTAIVGQEMAKLALLCNAVNPSIGGVLLSGDKGCGKSTMVRALADVLPEIDVVKGCPFNCNPHNELEMCEACRMKAKDGSIETEKRRMKVVDLPLSVTVDRLVGTIDIERALKEGIKALQPGILAEANRNILYIDEVNLLDDYIADILLDAAAMGWNVIEREGISLAHPSRFILVGSMNPEEGELRPQILDRFGLFVRIEAIKDVDKRVEIIRRVEEFQADPIAFRKKYENEQKKLRDRIVKAREIVGKVEIDEDLLKLLAKTIVEMGIKTHRAEIVTVRTAKAIASLDGRRKVTLDDLKKAMELALPHRLRDRPFEHPPHPPKQEDGEELRSPKILGNGRGTKKEGTGEKRSSDIMNVDVKVSDGDEHSVKSASRGSRDERAMVIGHPHGYPISYVPSNVLRDVDIVATIRTWAVSGGANITDCIRVRVRKTRLPRLTVIALDTSGSMLAKKRIAVAKGIAKRLIENGYVKRDYLSLITFRGFHAEVLVPPTRRYSNVMSALQNVAVGGRTPLSSALQTLLHIIRAFKLKNRNSVVRCILITDGKANTSLYGKPIKEELKILASAIRRNDVRFEIYDTRKIVDPTPSYVDLLSSLLNAKVHRV